MLNICQSTDHDHNLLRLFNSSTEASTSCKILVKIGPVTSEFKRAKIENCAATRLQFDDRLSFSVLAF